MVPVAARLLADVDVLILIAPASAIALITLSEVAETVMSPLEVMLTPAMSCSPMSAFVSKSISLRE